MEEGLRSLFKLASYLALPLRNGCVSWSSMETLLTSTRKYQVHPRMLPVLTLVTGGTLGISSALWYLCPSLNPREIWCAHCGQENSGPGGKPHTPPAGLCNMPGILQLTLLHLSPKGSGWGQRNERAKPPAALPGHRAGEQAAVQPPSAGWLIAAVRPLPWTVTRAPDRCDL